MERVKLCSCWYMTVIKSQWYRLMLLNVWIQYYFPSLFTSKTTMIPTTKVIQSRVAVMTSLPWRNQAWSFTAAWTTLLTFTVVAIWEVSLSKRVCILVLATTYMYVVTVNIFLNYNSKAFKYSKMLWWKLTKSCIGQLSKFLNVILYWKLLRRVEICNVTKP